MNPGPHPLPDPEPARPGSVLGPADPEALAEAARELRNRTMGLEPYAPMPALLIVLITGGTVGLVVIGFVFRHSLRAFFGFG